MNHTTSHIAPSYSPSSQFIKWGSFLHIFIISFTSSKILWWVAFQCYQCPLRGGFLEVNISTTIPLFLVTTCCQSCRGVWFLYRLDLGVSVTNLALVQVTPGELISLDEFYSRISTLKLLNIFSRLLG